MKRNPFLALQSRPHIGSKNPKEAFLICPLFNFLLGSHYFEKIMENIVRILMPYVGFDFKFPFSSLGTAPIKNFNFYDYNSSVITNTGDREQVLRWLQLIFNVRFPKTGRSLPQFTSEEELRSHVKYNSSILWKWLDFIEESKYREEILKCNRTVYVDHENGPLEKMLAQLRLRKESTAKGLLLYKGKKPILAYDIGFHIVNMFWDQDTLKTLIQVIQQSGLLLMWTRVRTELDLRNSLRGTDLHPNPLDDKQEYKALGFHSQIMAVFLVYFIFVLFAYLVFIVENVGIICKSLRSMCSHIRRGASAGASCIPTCISTKSSSVILLKENKTN
jgi:hypothetical protein